MSGDMNSSSSVRLLLLDITVPGYAPPGYLFYAQRRSLFARRFNVKSINLSGDPDRLADTLDDVGPGDSRRNATGMAS